jgi:hypothetical protein
MFAKTIIDSDAFLDMPISARLLYYDLAMRADDDGFINSPKKIMKFIGATNDDMNILILRKFIIPFDNGVVVIKHWRIHNYIRKDTYNETSYKEEKALLELDENKAYRLSSQLSVDESLTQVRLGKVSIGKDSIGKDNIPPISPKGGKGKTETVYYPDDEKLNQAFADFVEMRKKIKRPMTERAITLAMNKLKKLSAIPFSDSMDNDLAIQILEQSTMNCWQDLYPLKDNSNKRSSSSGVDWDNV